MKKKLIYIFILFLYLSNNIDVDKNNMLKFETEYIPIIEPLYYNVWGTIYNAEKKQCDNNPTITGDNSYIDINNASSLRWIAISQEMLHCDYRIKLINDSSSILYKGKINYGDSVWIQSSNKNINGWWIVHDTKNKKYINSIDFLQTKGDGSLYNNNPNWNGRFENLKIYKVKI